MRGSGAADNVFVTLGFLTDACGGRRSFRPGGSFLLKVSGSQIEWSGKFKNGSIWVTAVAVCVRVFITELFSELTADLYVSSNLHRYQFFSLLKLEQIADKPTIQFKGAFQGKWVNVLEFFLSIKFCHSHNSTYGKQEYCGIVITCRKILFYAPSVQNTL